MIWNCLDSLAILTAFLLAYILPPFIAMRRLQPAADLTTQMVLSAGLGLSSQALLGFFWNHLLARSPAVEIGTYFLLWLIISLFFVQRPHSSPTPIIPVPRFSLSLPLILFAAVALRNMDSLTHSALGQSDAYTHLQFLRDVILQGEIRNIVYPPGYSWVLALPVMTFHLDAYLAARYGGAFFGMLMVAVLYLLGRRHSLLAGLLAAFFAAVCPLFYPLIKTGMGAFANQLGLYLLPLTLLVYLGRSNSGMPLIFTVLLLGLTVSVPLFVFTLTLILLIHRLTCFPLPEPCGRRTAPGVAPTTPGDWARQTLQLLLPIFLAVALSCFHFLSPGKLHLTTTSTLVTGIETPKRAALDAGIAQHPILTRLKTNIAGKLMIDLLTIKHKGLGNAVMNLATLMLAGLFSAMLLAGFRMHQAAASDDGNVVFLKLLGGWGLLNTVQVSTGLLEFSLYQRSGWLLLESAALAGGILSAYILSQPRAGKVLRPVMLSGMAMMTVLAFWIPPRHRYITSGAENELTNVLRELSCARITAREIKGPLSFERHTPSDLVLRAAIFPKLVVFTRRYTGFNADQGNLADVIPDPAADILQIPVEMTTRLAPPAGNFLCLIDRCSGLPEMGILNRISPELTQSLNQFQTMLYAPNDVILSFLNTLSPELWRITREDRGNNLSLILAERLIR